MEIHGLESKYAWVGSLHRQVNWTAGCIAVTNSEIERNLADGSGRNARSNTPLKQAQAWFAALRL